MKKVILAGICHDQNMGDVLLFDCHKYLLNRSTQKQLEVVTIDFFCRHLKENGEIVYPQDKVPLYVLPHRVLRKIYKKVTGKDAVLLDQYIYEHSGSAGYKELREEIMKNIDGVDTIIIVGAGTLKYDIRVNFAPYYKLIVECAQSANIKVIVSAVGIESEYDDADKRSRMFEKALNHQCVAIVTSRDREDLLKKYVHESHVWAKKTIDPGIWSSQVYGIDKATRTNTVGLGIIAPQRFLDFGRNITKNQYYTICTDIFARLLQQGYDVQLFCNGFTEDYDAARDVCEIIGISLEKYIARPTVPEELVKTISNYVGIISSRLHSCIVAYSLHIPFVALTWNNKLHYFAEEIQVPTRAIEIVKSNGDDIVSEFCNALQEGYDERLYAQFIKESSNTFKHYMDVIESEDKG